MPQEMNILCCYSCKMFQVHIVKKAPKWQCKLCNEKQSVQQVYFQGSGKDCRLQVQQLNSLKANEMLVCAMASTQNDRNSNCSTIVNTSQESNSDKTIESKQYLESLFDTEDFIFENINNDSCDFKNVIDDPDFETKVNDNYETEESYSMNYNDNSNINDISNSQNNIKPKYDYNNATNIFETYSDLSVPLDS